MRTAAIAISGMVFLSSCADATKMDRAEAFREFTVAENYQAVYARSLKAFRACWGTGAGYDIDGQLYSELGYGEINQGAQMVGDQVRIKYAAEGNGTRVTIKLRAIGGKQLIARLFEQWARGNPSCKAPPAR